MAFSLFGNRQKKIPESKQVQEIELDKIMPNRYQPRHTFSDESIEELATTLKEQGLLQPIILRKPADGPEGEYEIIAGERRFRASKLAKKKTIPAIIREFDEAQMMEVAVLENLQREDLTPLEEAQAYEMLQKNLGLTQAEVSKRLGKSRPYIANYLRLLTLPQKTKRLLQRGELSMGQARTLLGLKDKDSIDDLARKVVKNGITVRQLESLVAKLNEKEKKPKKKSIKKSAFIRATESQLTDKFGTSVNITEGKKGNGHLAIDFASTDELNRILDLLGINLDK